MAFAGTRSATLEADTKEIATKQGRGGRQLEGAVDSSKAGSGLGSDAQHRVCHLLQANCAFCWELGLDLGFLMLARLGGHRHIPGDP